MSGATIQALGIEAKPDPAEPALVDVWESAKHTPSPIDGYFGGVCKNPMATKVLAELSEENYAKEIKLNARSDSIYMGTLGAAMFGLDDVRAGRPCMLPTFDGTGAAIRAHA